MSPRGSVRSGGRSTVAGLAAVTGACGVLPQPDSPSNAAPTVTRVQSRRAMPQYVSPSHGGRAVLSVGPARTDRLAWCWSLDPCHRPSRMDDSLYFNEQHHEVREMVREFSRTQIAPVARELDQTSTFPWDNIKAMGELGLLGVPWGEELGGAGLDQLSYYITIHEMAKVDASHALTISAHTNLGTSPIVEFGTEEQKRRHVPLLASGRVLGGFGLTEPGAGSDAGGTATLAVDKGDHFLINGSKIFITHAGVGEIFVITARTEPEG